MSITHAHSSSQSMQNHIWNDKTDDHLFEKQKNPAQIYLDEEIFSAIESLRTSVQNIAFLGQKQEAVFIIWEFKTSHERGCQALCRYPELLLSRFISNTALYQYCSPGTQYLASEGVKTRDQGSQETSATLWSLAPRMTLSLLVHNLP